MSIITLFKQNKYFLFLMVALGLLQPLDLLFLLNPIVDQKE